MCVVATEHAFNVSHDMDDWRGKACCEGDWQPVMPLSPTFFSFSQWCLSESASSFVLLVLVMSWGCCLVVLPCLCGVSKPLCFC